MKKRAIFVLLFGLLGAIAQPALAASAAQAAPPASQPQDAGRTQQFIQLANGWMEGSTSTTDEQQLAQPDPDLVVYLTLMMDLILNGRRRFLNCCSNITPQPLFLKLDATSAATQKSAYRWLKAAIPLGCTAITTSTSPSWVTQIFTWKWWIHAQPSPLHWRQTRRLKER